MPGQYSLSKIDTPQFGRVLAFSQRKDFLALSVAFTTHDVITTALAMDNSLTEKITGEGLEEQEMARSDNAVIQSVCGLFTVLERTIPSEFLWKNRMKEIIYDILCGSCGKQFLQSTVNVGQAGEIYRANSWIKENFRESFTVEQLAERGTMSVSLFHQKFKSAVGMGPLQCQKRLRLCCGGSSLDGHSDKRCPYYPCGRRISAFCKWKDCRRNWRWRGDRGARLQNCGICGVCI